MSSETSLLQTQARVARSCNPFKFLRALTFSGGVVTNSSSWKAELENKMFSIVQREVDNELEEHMVLS